MAEAHHDTTQDQTGTWQSEGTGEAAMAGFKIKEFDFRDGQWERERQSDKLTIYKALYGPSHVKVVREDGSTEHCSITSKGDKVEIVDTEDGFFSIHLPDDASCKK